MTSTVCISILEVKDVKDIENRKQYEQSNCTYSALNPIFLEQYLPLKTPVWFENSALAAVVLVQIWCGNIIYNFYPTRSLLSITVIYDPRVRWNICVPTLLVFLTRVLRWLLASHTGSARRRWIILLAAIDDSYMSWLYISISSLTIINRISWHKKVKSN